MGEGLIRRSGGPARAVGGGMRQDAPCRSCGQGAQDLVAGTVSNRPQRRSDDLGHLAVSW